MVKALVGLEESEIENDFVWTPENYGKSIFSSLFAESEKMKVSKTLGLCKFVSGSAHIHCE